MGQIRRLGRTFWIRYSRDGRRFEENAHTSKEQEARRLLKIREGDIAKGIPVTPKLGQVRFDETAQDLLNDYTTNGKRSYPVVKRRVEKHLRPYFGGRRLSSITTADVRAYVAHRQTQGIVAVRGARTGERIGDVSNAEINRELQHLKRIFSLAIQAEKVWRKPYIPLLVESSPRAGFFEREAFESVRSHLPAPLQSVVTFAYVTGWRVPSEVQTLRWPQVDFAAKTVVLEPGTTKNDEGRVFPFTDELRAVLETQRAAADALTSTGVITPWVFFRLVAKGRGGPTQPKPILTFSKTWKVACAAAGCPGRIPHDFRRTAVRNLVRAGIPERVAQQMTGHKTRSIFERYNIVSAGDLLDAAQKANIYAREQQAAAKLGKSWENSRRSDARSRVNAQER